jgi:hypothetical protein
VQDGEPAGARVEDPDRPCVHALDSRPTGGRNRPALNGSLEYSHARVFEREATIRLPDTMSLRC